MQTHGLIRFLISTFTLLALGIVAAGQTAALPLTLRPELYQALDQDAGPAYAIDKTGCAHVSAQALYGCFTADGVHFAGTVAPAVTLQLAAFGRGESLQRLHAVTPIIEGNHVQYAHGTLTEWWKVLPVGFEQGFSLTQRLSGQGMLTLALTASHNAVARGQELIWGQLRYGSLVVIDANHKVVPATLKTEHGQILISVNDTQAIYPLTVDPLVWIEQKLTASDGAANDQFGTVVAISGSTAVVGVPFATVGGNANQGAVYVFTGSGGSWSQTQKLTASDGTASNEFGTVVAISGSTAVVGVPFATVGGNANQGAVYVFTGSGGSWSQTQKLTASDGVAYDEFGTSVAVSGSNALIGAPFKASEGYAYVFTVSGSIWSQMQEFTASPAISGGYFGYAVALDGSTALVGAEQAKVGGNSYQGAAYIFTSSGGSWSQIQQLTASDGAANDHFGWAVTVSGNTALIGVPFATVGGNTYQGAAYVFTDSGGSWSQTQKLTASDGAEAANFGHGVAVSGSTALVGAEQANIGSNDYQGAAYVFTSSGGSWSQTQKLTASDGASLDEFGWAVALDGSTALVGAPYANVDFKSEQGVAYIYGGSDLDLALSAPTAVNTGAQYTSQAIVTNSAGTPTPAAVAVTLSVPTAASYVSTSTSQGSCSETAGVVSCNFGQIAGGGGTATANVMLMATGSHGTTISNSASVVATPALMATALTVIDTAPIANNGSVSTPMDTTVSGMLSATPGYTGQILSFAITVLPAHGMVTLTNATTGAFTYTPTSGFSGSDSFNFTAGDGIVTSNTATESITVGTSCVIHTFAPGFLEQTRRFQCLNQPTKKHQI